MRIQKGLFIVFILVLILICKEKAFAASISATLQNPTGNFGPSDEVLLHTNLSINATDGTEYFLRGVAFKDSDTNYCGFTWNGSDWFSGPYTQSEGWKNFLKISILDNKWEGDMKFRIDPNDSGCTTSGNYNLKIERFTNSGSGNFDNQNNLVLNYSIPTITPTPQPTSTPAPTSKPTSTPIIVPTLKLTYGPEKVASNTPTSKISVTKSIVTSEITNSNEGVLGSDTQENLKSQDKKPPTKYNFGKLFIIMGTVILCSLCGILGYKKYKEAKETEI